MQRRVTPEILDHLPSDDPEAIGSRRDLARINWVMGQHRLMARALTPLPKPPMIVDLGSGDGRFLLGVARRLGWRGVHAVILDAHDIVSSKTRTDFAAIGWTLEHRIGDVFDRLTGISDAPLITANLFLHHFDEAALPRLLALIAQKAGCFVACEPRRSRFALAGAHLVGALGANRVTRHDAVASVRAGLTGQELSRLWPAGWQCRDCFAFPFTHLFTAQR